MASGSQSDSMQSYSEESDWEDDYYNYDSDHFEYTRLPRSLMYPDSPVRNRFTHDDFVDDDGGFEREWTGRELEEDTSHLEALVANTERRMRAVTLGSNVHPPANAANHTATSTMPEVTQAMPGEDTCIVCFDMVPDCKLIGCNHSKTGLFCKACATRIVNETKKCPLCRLAITAFEVVPVEREVPDAWDDE